MQYFHVCIQCGNPTPEESTNIVITDINDNDNRAKQTYCGQCFKGLTKETIAKNKNNNTKSTKNNTTKGCCSGH